MSIKETINEKLKDAMRNHDEDGKRVYRMILSSIKFIEKTEKRDLDDEEVVRILQKELKIRRETLAEAEKGDREAAREEAMKDIALIEPFLPKQMSEEELRAGHHDLGALVVKDLFRIVQDHEGILRGFGNVILLPREHHPAHDADGQTERACDRCDFFQKTTSHADCPPSTN